MGNRADANTRADSDQRVARIHALAIRAFRAAGVDGPVIEDPNDPYNAVILSTTGTEYGLANLTLACIAIPRLLWRARIRSHVTTIVAMTEVDEPVDLGDPEVRSGIRSRLLPEDGLPDFVATRHVAPGLVEALCVDLPRTVEFVGDRSMAGHDLDALLDMGRSQLQFERIDERGELAPGISAVIGNSFFTGSHVLNPRFVARELADAPRGFVFLAPDRHRLFIAPVVGGASIIPITKLAQFAASIDAAMLPGGLVSASLYFTDGMVVERISQVDEDSGQPGIVADGAFLQAINV